MNDRFRICLDTVLRHEGGLIENPGAPDAIMAYGVTIPALQTWLGVNHVVTPAHIRDLTPAAVTPIYLVFWRALHADYLPCGVDLAAFDAAVNYTPRVGVLMLQKALEACGAEIGQVEAGLVGPDTINAALAADPAAVIEALAALRRAADREPAERIASITAEALAMIRPDDSQAAA
jgi:lysozyme family protein